MPSATRSLTTSATETATTATNDSPPPNNDSGSPPDDVSSPTKTQGPLGGVLGMRLRIAIAAGVAVSALAAAVPAMATVGTGSLFHDGAVVGTVVVSAPVPAGSGTDPFYKVTNGASGQLGIAGVAPGD